MSLLVLGLGNVLMGDEGVGVQALAGLDRDRLPAGAAVIDGGTGGFHLLDYLQRYTSIVMVDAALDGQPAGTVSVLRPEYASDFPRSLTAHDVGLRDLVEAAALLGPLPAVTLITVSIEAVRAMTTDLSPDVARALPMVRALVRQIACEANRWSPGPSGPGSTHA